MSWCITTQIWVVYLIGWNYVLQPISSTFRPIIAGSEGHWYQNKRSTFNPRLSFNRSYHTDREPVRCTCTCRNISPNITVITGIRSVFISELWSLLLLLVILLDFLETFILLLLNLISTVHKQSKNRGQNTCVASIKSTTQADIFFHSTCCSTVLFSSVIVK